MGPEAILQFWFQELEPSHWFVKDPNLDEEIRRRFIEIHSKVSQGLTKEWRHTAKGTLAEILVLDQFSRNMFRDTPEAFAYDSMALELAQKAIEAGRAKELSPVQKSFLYMPFMHSESKEIHARAVLLFSEPGLEQNLKYEYAHKKIIDRFGRYPHRNKILGRSSTPEEVEFLKTEGSSF